MRVEGTNRKLRVLITFRVLFVTILLVAFFALHLDFRFFPYPQLVLFIITVFYSLSIIYLVLLKKRIIRPQPFGYIQLILDVILVVFFILVTGGIESWFTVTLLLVIISSSIVIDRKAGFIMATAAGILYGVVIDLQYYGIIPVQYSGDLAEKDFLYHIVINLSALYLTAYLIGHLTEGLEKTKKSLAEKSSDLRELSHFHSDVIENIPSGLYSTDIEGNIKLFNKAAEDICGTSREDMLDRCINDIFPFITVPIRPNRYNGTLEAEGKKKYIGMSISEYKDTDNRTVGYIGTFQDLTEIVRLEKEVKTREKFAAIGELAANIAHEIRNPLASIKGSIEIIREGVIKSADKERLMDIALHEMTRLNTIVTDFLGYSNPRPLSIKRCDVGHLVANAVTLMKTAKTVRDGITFREDIHPALYADADEDKLRQVFWNLMTNAVEAIKAEGTISVAAKGGEGEVLIEVEDSGEGIKREDMERIFYPFYSTKKGGSGLGLAIAYRIIDEHHGSIEVRSDKAKGASFLIKLPRSQS